MKNQKFGKLFLQFILTLILVIPGVQLMAQAPTATTNAATGIGSTGATVNGTVNANGSSTTVTFEYGLTDEYGSSMLAAQSPVSGSTATPVTADLNLLDPLIEYHYRVVAVNASGTTYGGDMTFTTTALSGNPPAVITDAASGIGADSATLNGQVNTFNVSTTVTFEWGTDTGYGNTVTADQSPLTSGAFTPVTASLTGLANNTTFHYRVVASNVNGTRYGADMTFAIGTGGTAPAAVTNAATGVTGIGATLNGTVNANGDTTVVTFEFGLDTGYGTTVSAAPSPVSGSTATAVSAASPDLLPNTTYHYRVVGTNSFGTTNGADMTLTTLPLAPTAVTNAASPVGTTTATLNGTVNANSGSTTVTFEYGLDTGYGTTVTAAQSPVTGSTGTAVSSAISGLTNGLTYHYRVVAVNAGGTTNGADMTFTTGAVAPTATTDAASGVGTTTATLNGTVNANNDSTTVTFEYGNSTNYNRTTAATPGTVTGSSDTPVNAAVSTLTPNMTYHYRVAANNAGGTTYGADMTFTTGPGPEVTTDAASAVGTDGATLNGTVNANNDSTTVTIEYGLTTAYGTTVTADQSPVTGTADTGVSVTLTNVLSAATEYHYRVVGQNSGGTTYGADMTFTTGAGHNDAPTATTLTATGVGTTGATLRGSVDSKNYSTTVTFEYGTDTSYGTTVTADISPITYDGGAVTVTNTLAGLTPGTTYHYRVVAQNAYGTAYGGDMTFYTGAPAAPTATTDAASAVGFGGATLNGTVNANNSNTIVRFEYGLTVAYGTTTFADQSPVTGTVNTAVTLSVTGLTAGTTYHYRVTAQNANGTVNGADMTFTTAAAPTAVTDPASAVGTTSATLNGTVNSNGGSTTVTFEYGLDTNYGNTVTADQDPVTGGTDTAVSNTPTTLQPNTTYHYRVVAQKGSDIIYGTDLTFTTTNSPPTADTNAATAVTATGATLNGIVNANNDSTTVTFEYGLTPAYGSTATATQSPVTGGGNTAVSRAITGLTVNTTYYYRVMAQSGSGTTYGAGMTFFTGVTLPTVTTGTATGISSTGATMNGTVTANNDTTTVTFQYGETTSYGRTVTADQSPLTGSTSTAVSVTVNDLNPNTLYHFRAVGQNAAGTSNGADMTFTTSATGTPVVTTANVTNIAASSATSGGNVTDEGDAPVTARGVCWSTAPSPTTADNQTIDGTGPGAFTSNLTGLSGSTTYYVRAYATNLFGTGYGQEFAFTTNAINTPTVTTANVTDITADSATSGGNVTANGGSGINAKGVCWSTAPNPTVANNRTTDGSGLGAFTSYLFNLSTGTTYHVRAYATNSAGTGYGQQLEFTTSSGVVSVAITEPGDGEVVSGTVTIAASASVSSSDSSFSAVMALSIDRVEFYIDDALIGQDTSSPYEIQWDSTSVADGSHAVKAVAYDQDDNTVEDEITVTTQNATGPAELMLNRDNLNFGAVMGGGATTGAQTLLINKANGGTLNWTVAFTSDWLACTPDSGDGVGVVSVGVDASALAAGTYSDTITVTNNGAEGGTATVPVNLTVYNNGSTSSPFGFFSTPIDNSTVMSNVPVTGWILDDIETTAVQIYRAPVAGEGTGMVYIGDAVMVEGARPDVEEAYPGYPLNYRAGWGYMLLSNFLPNQGNGTFTLYAKATDKEGHTVTLGSKTIIADNANAVKPFGTIDTPAQGGTADGSSYVNFGWALTPQPNTIPTDGSTIMVYVDGVPLGNPVYNQYREDIATLFPGYNNSDGAVGYFYLDTTAYTNGVHTIAWSVTDDVGNSDGNGSRYFNIINTGGSRVGSTGGAYTNHRFKGPQGSQTEINTPELTIKEVQHVEFQVINDFSSIRGYLSVNGKLRPLPIGSTLDTDTGRFYWDPGAGFVGTYNLVFVIETPDGGVHKKTTTITIEAK